VTPHGVGSAHDEEAVGAVYDHGLAKRLVRYLRPYLKEIVLSVALLLAISLLEVAGPYLTKVATFSKPPEIGDKWPAEGYFIPSKRAFLAEFEKRASPNTVQRLLLTVAEAKTAAPSAGH